MGNENGKVNEIPKLPSKLDLVQSAQNHYAFIQAAKFNQHLFHPKVLKYAIFRYENFWLPFAAQHVEKVLVAPIDIELVWAAHLQDPDAYNKDCLKVAKMLIPHHHVTLEERKNNEETKLLWEQKYEDQVPLVINHKRYPEVLMEYTSVVSIDLTEAVQKYRSFIHHVSLPHYKDAKFLLSAIQNYLRGSLNNDKNLLGTRDKEFIMRTHMLAPLAYQIDGDKLREKNRKSKLEKKASVKTSPRVSTEYKAPNGSQSRGEIIPLIQATDEKKLQTSANKTVTFHILEYNFANLTPGKHYRLKIRSKSLMSQRETVLQALRVPETGYCNNISIDETTFQYDSSCADVLQIRVSEIKMTHSSVQEKQDQELYQEHETFSFDYDLFNCDGYTDGEEMKLEFSIANPKGKIQQSSESSWIKLRCHVIKQGGVNLFFGMKLANISQADHLCKVLSHPLLMAPYYAKRAKHPCIYVTKTLKDRRNETIYKCRVVKSVEGDFLCTEVFNVCEKLVSSSYTVGTEVLPLEEQVLNPTTCCVLRETGEAAFIIRSTNYDWGILKIFPMINEDDDAIIPKKIIFMNLRDIQLKWEKLYDADKHTTIIDYKTSSAHQLLVDINFGRISLPPTLQEFPELLSLGVTILALFHCFPYKGTLGHTYGRRHVGN